MRENRTYDQILGDDPRGDGDPKLTLFGEDITPNMHALVKRFPLLDHVYANSEASIDGHFWTAAGRVSDYVVKNWHQNYAGRERPYDFGVYAVTWPAKGFLFDQAEKQGISYFNYGEAVAGDVPLFTDKDRTPRRPARSNAKFAQVRPRRDAGVPARRRLLPERRRRPASQRAQRQQRGVRLAPPRGRAAAARSRASSASSSKFTTQLGDRARVPAFNYLDAAPTTTPRARAPGAARRTRWSPTTTTRSARSST